MQVMNNLGSPVKAGLDILSVTFITGAWLQFLPHIAAGLSIIWTILRIFEAVLALRDRWRYNGKSNGEKP